jgi:hypothetical protein
LGIGGVGRAEDVIGPADKTNTLHPGLNDDVLQALDPSEEKVLQGVRRVADSHEGMKVGPAQIRVYEDDFVSQARQRDAQPQGEDAFPDPPLATANAP